MQSCGVCFPCGKTAQEETRYVAPDLLPKFEAVAGRLHAWKEDSSTPVLRLEYQFFHPAVIRGLMSRIGREAGDLAEYWKYGLWLKDGRRIPNSWSNSRTPARTRCRAPGRWN